MIGRRQAIVGAVAGAAFMGGGAEACSLTATRLVQFDDLACRRQLQAWVDLVNAGPDMPLERLTPLVDEMSVTINDQEMIAAAVGERNGVDSETDRNYLFYKGFRAIDGHPDPRPIRISEVNRVRRLRNQATYQFTLERYSYHAADLDGCNGMFPTHGEYYGVEQTSYLATFLNNLLRTVRPFPEWYLERVA